MATHAPEAMAASWKGRCEGRCCRAKIRPPIEGASSLAAMRARGGPAGLRFAARRGASPSAPTCSLAWASGRGGGGAAGPGAGNAARSTITLAAERCTASRCVFPSWTIPLSISAARPNPHQPRDIAHFPRGAQAAGKEKMVISQPLRLPTDPSACPPLDGLAIGAIGQNQDFSSPGPPQPVVEVNFYQPLGICRAVNATL